MYHFSVDDDEWKVGYAHKSFVKCFNCGAFSLQAHMSNTKGGDKQYRHNQQLEELRNLQDKLSGEKASWAATKEQEEKELEEKRQELLRLQVINVFHLNVMHY